MPIKITDRLRAAYQLVCKGSIAPFDRVGLTGGVGERLRQPYKNSPWVMRAVKHVSGPIAAVPLAWTLAEEDYTDTDFEAWWETPAQGLTRSDWVEATIGWLKIAGEAFWVLGDDWLRPFPEVGGWSKLLVVSPERMKHVVKGGELLGWEYMAPNGRRELLLNEQVVHVKCWNPYDPWRGLGELETALQAAESDWLAGKYQGNLMRNNGDQGVYVVAKNGVLDQTQRDQIIAQLRDKRERSLRGEYRPVFLTGDITVTDPVAKALDAAMLQGRLHNRHEIFIALGVPASMADVMASYSVGSASDRYRLIEETCMPAGEKLADMCQRIGQRMTGKDLRVALDWDEHSVMQQVRRERIDAATKLWAMGVPLKDCNEYLKLGMPEVEGWEVGYLPFSVSPTSSMDLGLPGYDEPTEEEPDAPEEDADPVELMLKALRQGRQNEAGTTKNEEITTACACGCGVTWQGLEVVVDHTRDAKELALWKSQMAKRRAVMRDFERKAQREFFKARSEVLRKLAEAGAAGKALHTKATAADFIFDLEQWRKGFLTTMRGAHENGLREAWAQQMAELGRDDPFAMAAENVKRYLSLRENRLSGVADDTWRRIQETLQDGLDEGASMDELAKRVRVEFNGISQGRAVAIAQTETGAAYGQGRQESQRAAGIQWKQWLTSGNPNVRASHAAANGQTVRIDEPFKVGGENLMFPGDPAGSPGNVINCHCVSIAVEKEEA